MPQPAFHGPLPAVGTVAPTLRYVNPDRQEKSLADHQGEVVVLTAFPSVDTKVCATQTRTFNKQAADTGARVLTISMDLPFALNRFCAAEGIANVETGSDFRHRDAALVWGAAIIEGAMAGTLGRITWVIDREGVIRYLEVAPELGAEPDYEAALNAAKSLL
ncbi:MAG TPA: thiol peroxidase [Flavobacteriales bacterium]|nr:thiol peroxidase [Flavobacteriales bacterium]HNU56799.1 thiol peroxidase [Flavobacteriales bacterium]